MERLCPGIELYQPIVTNVNPQENPDGSQEQPQLIILATWMAAKPEHTAKYVSGYQAIYPTARILVVRSTIKDMLFRTYPKRRSLLQSAIEAMATPAESSTSTEPPRILLHVFSNGGASQTRVLLRAHLDLTGKALPLHATVLDSCPGRGSIRRSYAALASSLPAHVRWLLSPAILAVLGLYWLCFRPWGVADPIERLRVALNSPELVRETHRCYVYSDADPMVAWQDVEAHARDAEAAGFSTRREKFSGTGHCAHAKGEGATRYWTIVQETCAGETGGLARMQVS
ncbi:Transmembrane protein 53 [Lasiodiplodia hormozganensis]|uniref:Transmembrane protein 53 n=1 Tax=Lasiodiplodia hormozganensis TaxID=869390 RepID=A0AA39XQ26_9PEZI|nr:Transmembrane protein 53 [Lasiodiplodia hormozganensis]